MQMIVQKIKLIFPYCSDAIEEGIKENTLLV